MKRIKTITSFNVSQTSHIYALFTDHGKIGYEFSKNHPSIPITFIDIRKHLIENLKTRKLPKKHYFFHALDAALPRRPARGTPREQTSSCVPRAAPHATVPRR